MSSNKKVVSVAESFQPWSTPWPAKELEHVSVCPVCGSAVREILHEELIDNVFYCALGKWASWRCLGCHCVYLDPRPSPASIHLAYGTYYTHQEVPVKSLYAELGLLRRLRRRMVNGYTNWRFSTKESPASMFGALALRIVWPLRKRLDREYRNLPRLPPGGKLLDLGCGDGSFLQIAKSCGWDAVGVDPDAKAVANCKSQGFSVIQGGIDYFEDKEAFFHVITLNHVIEHLHDPVEVLASCWRLLKPGGQLWLETPNIDSHGHARFREYWRGLEPPRHLVLFNPNSLETALKKAGFLRIKNISCPSPLVSMTKASEAIRQGLSIDNDIHISNLLKLQLKKEQIIQAINPSRKEFLTVIAIKENNQK